MSLRALPSRLILNHTWHVLWATDRQISDLERSYMGHVCEELRTRDKEREDNEGTFKPRKEMQGVRNQCI